MPLQMLTANPRKVDVLRLERFATFSGDVFSGVVSYADHPTPLSLDSI